MSNFKLIIRLMLFVMTCFLLVMCTVTDQNSGKVLDINVPDTLSAFESIKIDILDATDSSIYKAGVFNGHYDKEKQAGKIKDLDLGNNPPEHFIVVVTGYQSGKPVQQWKIVFSGNTQQGKAEIVKVNVPTNDTALFAIQPNVLLLHPTDSTTVKAIFKNSLQPAEVVWKSENTGIATISETGLVVAIATGSTKLLATLKSDTTQKVSRAIEVVEKPVVKPIPTSVRINAASPYAMAFGGASATLSAEILPSSADQEVLFSIEPAEIASIESVTLQTVTLKPLKVGVATLTAKSKFDPAKLTTLQISVVKAPDNVTGIKINPPKVLLYVGGTPGLLQANLEPATSIAAIEYHSSDEGVVKSDNTGALMPIKKGNAIVTVNPVGLPLITAICSVTVDIDPPLLDVGTDRAAKLGEELTFPIKVTQKYGTIVSLKWDLDGDGKFEGEAKDTNAAAPKFTYTQNGKKIDATFYAKDSEGNETTKKVSITVNSKAPFVVITKPAAAETTLTTSNFTLEYTVDGVLKTRPITGLKEGSNPQLVSEKSSEGLIGSDSVNLILDTTPPKVAITSPSDGVFTAANSINVDWTVDGVSQTTAKQESLGGKQGEVTITREATDAFGNKGLATVKIQRDTIAPIAPIFVDDVSGTTPSPTNNTKPKWVWMSGNTGGNSALAGNGVFRYSLDGAATIETQLKEFSPITALNAGSHVLSLQERDVTGNWSAISTRSITIKTTGPLVEIVSPANGLVTNATPVNVVWKVDGVSQTTQLSEVLKEGVNTITRTATDPAGNSGSASVQVTLDKTPPGQPIIVTVPVTPGKTRSPKWGWASGSGGVGNYKIWLNNIAQPNSNTPSFTGANLVDGSYSLKVVELDGLGNESLPLIFTDVNVDGSVPVISVSGFTNNQTVSFTDKNKLNFTGTVTDAGGSGLINFSYSISGNTSQSSISLPINGTFSTGDLTLKNGGASIITFSANDGANNAASFSVTVNVNVPAPLVTFESPRDKFVTNRSSIDLVWYENGKKNTETISLDIPNVDGTTKATTVTKTTTNAIGESSAPKSITFYRVPSNVRFLKPTGPYGDCSSWENGCQLNKATLSGFSVNQDIWLLEGDYPVDTRNTIYQVHLYGGFRITDFSVGNRTGGNSSLIGNEADGYMLDLTGGGSPTFDRIRFTGTNALGGIDFYSGILKIENCIFEGLSVTSAYGEGSAIRSQGGTINISNSKFLSNNGGNGAISGSYGESNIVNITGSTFSSNKSGAENWPQKPPPGTYLGDFIGDFKELNISGTKCVGAAGCL